jgi:hypothetical protein
VKPEELKGLFRDLKSQAEAGEISDEEFEAQLREFLFQDDSGTYWTLGAQTEKWYRHQDGDWVQAEPPATLERAEGQKQESHAEPPITSPSRASRPWRRAVLGGVAVLFFACLAVVAIVSYQYGLLSSAPGAATESPTLAPAATETPLPERTPSPTSGALTGSPSAEGSPSPEATATQEVPTSTPRPSATATVRASHTPQPTPALRHGAPTLLLPEDGAERGPGYYAVLIWEPVDNLGDDEYYHVEVCWNGCTTEYWGEYVRETTWIFPDFRRGAAVDDKFYWHVTVRAQQGEEPQGPLDPPTSPPSETWVFMLPQE